MSLTPEQIAEQHAWASGIDACTCQTAYDGDRYVVERHTCPVCLAWDQRMTQMGVSAAPFDSAQGTGRGKRRGASA